MGRRALLTLAATTAVACGPRVEPRADTGRAHAGLACAECHQGGLSEGRLPDVPPSTCTGCHEDDLPTHVSLASVRFEHRSHGSTGELTVGCAGCHTHASGSEPIEAGAETCGLCHADQLSGARAEDCRTCHGTLDHQGVTSQGVEVPHRGLPWIEGGCLRCHYQVSRPVHEVDRARCAACHGDVDAVTRAGIGVDLHPAHVGSSCGSCHEKDNHRIEAMSSAVDLQCADCHELEHEVRVDSVVDAATCSACHPTDHQDAQRLLLGVLTGAPGAMPSDHFMDGLTCRSCHLGPQRAGSGRPQVEPASCTQCHRDEYATVLRWWEQGIGERLGLVERYLEDAERASGRPAERARSLLELVEDGRGEHNLPLTHRILEEALTLATTAYREVGREAPPAPALGRAPRQGLCTYCHYTRAQAGFSTVMDDAFHREVLGLDSPRPGGAP